MHRYAWVSLLVVLFGCSDTTPGDAAAPSPLLSADPDRLWILARASKVGDGRNCKEHYLAPDDPRYQALSEKCDRWSRHYAEYLALNGFPTIEHPHLQQPVYWEWYISKRQQISKCWSDIGDLPVTASGAERAEHTRQRNACDPYDDARKNYGKTPSDLGVRFN